MLVEHFLLKIPDHVIGRANFWIHEYRAANVRIGDMKVHGHPVDETVRGFLDCFRRVDLPVEKDFARFSDDIHGDEDWWE
jgi:hypothetical protein